MQDPVVKRHTSKRKTYWCAPRKVKSVHTAQDGDNSLMKNVKTEKKTRKKKRKMIKKVRRIDILAQPKFISDKVNPNKKQPANVKLTDGSNRNHKIDKTPVSTNRTNFDSPRKISNVKKSKRKVEQKLPRNCTSNAAKNSSSSPIVLPKDIGVRLMSLVKKRIKELAKSKGVQDIIGTRL